jgi:putative membrane protein
MDSTQSRYSLPKQRRSLGAYLRDLLIGPKGPPKNLDANFLATDRTRLAHERTMMAWIRTGLSLISFGFTIYKFFQIQGIRTPFRDGLIGARGFGFMMILTGLVAVLLAGLSHRREMRSLRAAGIEVPPSMATIVGGLVSLLGILGLIAVVFRQ